jgi:hypothetical protein
MAKIPSQLYITTKNVGSEDNPELLGFLHAHEPGKAADSKRKQTQIEWAYMAHGLADFALVERFGQYFVTGWRWKWMGTAAHSVKESVDELCKYPPQVWDNKPMTGFKVLESVSRWSTSNKLWRIQDPRGAVFEISTDTFEKIVMDATIIKGTIDAECVWAGNKNLKVVL